MTTARRVPDQGIKENFFTTNGRLNRLRYFKRNFVVSLIYSLLTMPLNRLYPAPAELTGLLLKFIFFLPYIAVVYFLICRRLHDLGHGNGLAIVIVILSVISFFTPFTTFAVVLIIGIVSIAISLYLLFAKGTKGPNQYGPDPLA